MPNLNGLTALMFTTHYNREEIVSELLKHKADKSILDANGKTAIDYAKEKGFKNLLDV